MDAVEKVAERSARRALARRRLTLHRSRSRDPVAPGYGLYEIRDSDGTVVGGRGYTLPIAAVADWLAATQVPGGPGAPPARIADAAASVIAWRVRSRVVREFLHLAERLAADRDSDCYLPPAQRVKMKAIHDGAALEFGVVERGPFGNRLAGVLAEVERALLRQGTLWPGLSRAVVAEVVARALQQAESDDREQSGSDGSA